MAYDVDSTPAAYAAGRERSHSVRSLLLIVAFAGVLVLPLVRTGEVQLVTVALIVALATALHRAGPQRV